MAARQTLKNPQLRYTQTNNNVKNLCLELLDIIPFNTQTPKSANYLPLNQQLKYQQQYSALNIRTNRKYSALSRQLDLKRARLFKSKKQNLDSEKSIEKNVKSIVSQNDLRTSASSQVIFKYSDLKSLDKKNLNKKFKKAENLCWRNNSTSLQKLRKEKSFENPFGLNKLQNKLSYLETRLLDIKSVLFKKNFKKLNSSIDYTNKQKQTCDQFLKLNTKESQLSQISTDTVKKICHIKNFSAIASQPKPQFLKYFDKNPYSPRKSNIYYVSEMIRAIHQKNSIAIQHISTSMRTLKYLENQQIPSQSQILPKILNLKKKDFYRDKKTIVFDLDQTLIHCNQNPQMECDVRFSIDCLNGQQSNFIACINIRPHALRMLNQLSKYFEIIVFTASESSYANVVLDYLDPEKKLFSHRLFRQHCIQTSNNLYVKDLRILNRNLSEIIIVDNSIYSYRYQLENGIPILPYYEGNIDFELKQLTQYLKQLIDVPDVREINKKTFKLHEYTKFENTEELIQKLYING